MKNKKIVYVGTYTNDGIYIYEWSEGKLIEQRLSKPTINPSYLIYNKDQWILYSVNETDNYNGSYGGGVSAFKINQESGDLTFLNTQNTLGKHPCHLCSVYDQLFVANYSEGTISQFPIYADGSIGELKNTYKHRGSGPNKNRQEGPHVHFVSPHLSQLSAVDLGIDQVVFYNLRDDHLIEDYHLSLKPGSGPRHIAFYNEFIYVVNELSNEVVVYKGQKEIQIISTLPSQYSGESYAAAIKIDHKNKFLYVSNRGYDSMVVYKIDQISGFLTVVEWVSTEGSFPRDFTIIDDYMLVCNQKSNTIVSFKVNQNTGKLSYLNTYHVPSPVCISYIELTS